MARQVLPINQMVANDFLNTAALPLVPVVADGCIVDAGLSEQLMLVVTQTSGAPKNVTIKSIYGTASDKVFQLAATTGRASILLEGMRWENITGADKGKIYIDFETGFVGTIFALGTLK